MLAPAAAAAAQGQDEYLHSEIYRPFFTLRKGDDGKTRYESSRPRAPEARFDHPKAPGTVRVFVVGGSIANVFMRGDWRFGEGVETRLDTVLKRAFPDRRFEAANCGMAAYDSYRVRLVFEEVLRHRPDLIVVLSGNNESLGDGGAGSLTRRLNSYSFFRSLRSRLARALARFRTTPPSEASTAAERRRRLEHYERNLRAMARLAKRAGVRTILCTLPVNFRDMPPATGLPMWNRAFKEAVESLWRSELEAAGAGFGDYVRTRPEDPVGHYYLGRVLDAKGDPAGARRSYLKAVDLDRLVRASPSVNAVVRRVAKEEEAGLADIEKAFMDAAPDGLLGSLMFEDGVHWYPELNGLAARAVLDAVLKEAETGWAGLGPLKKRDRLRVEKVRAGLSAGEPRFSDATRYKVVREWLLYGISAVLTLYDGPRVWEREKLVPRSEPAVALFGLVHRHDSAALEALPAAKDELRETLTRNVWSAERARHFDEAWPSILEHASEARRRN